MRVKERDRLTAVLNALEGRLYAKQDDFAFDDDHYTIRVANDLATRRRAYEFIYELYLDKSFAKPDPSEMWFSIHDALPKTVTFVVENRSSEIVGAATVILDTEIGLPVDTIYPSEMKALRMKGRRPAEVTSLGVKEGIKGGMQVLVKLFNFVSIYARRIGQATDFMITVNPRHVSFYKRALLFNLAGEERNYGKVGGAPAVLLRLDFDDQLQAIPSGNGTETNRKPTRTLYKPFYPISEEPGIMRALKETIQPMTENEFRYFFIEQTNLFMRASATQRHYLEECYLACDLVEVA